jgi:hypothetical protein
MAEAQQYSFISFLPTNTDEEYDSSTFFNQDNLPTINKRLSRPATMLAPPPVIDNLFPEPKKPIASPENATGDNENIIVRAINDMVSVEIDLRLTARELDFVTKPRLTPNEMFVNEMKAEVAILQFYSGLIDEGKFDVLNVTMMSKARETTTHITEMLRQPHNFEDVPDLPRIARARVTAFLRRVEELIEKKMTSTSGTLEADTKSSLDLAESYLRMIAERKFNADKMLKPAKDVIASIRAEIAKSSKSEFAKRAKSTADLLETKLAEYQV